MHTGQTGHHATPIAKRIRLVLMSELCTTDENNGNGTEDSFYKETPDTLIPMDKESVPEHDERLKTFNQIPLLPPDQIPSFGCPLFY